MNEPENFCTLTWPGKEDSLRQVTAPSLLRLAERPERSHLAEHTANVFIEGDNLDALKLLMPQYRGAVDLAYIDPPYNTGHKMAYRDDFRTKRAPSGQQHANWCAMMYPRLALAYALLAPGGALFISIDDRELGQLRLLCDEICGPENFVAQLVWETKRGAKGIPPRSMCVINHEYVVVYAKSRNFHFKGELRQASAGFHNPDNDPRGPWKRQYLQRFGQGFPQRELRNPANGMVFRFETPYTEHKMNNWIAEGAIMFPSSSEHYPARKEYFAHYKNPYKPLLSLLGLYSTKTNSEKLKEMFNSIKCFDYPKPTALMRQLVEQACPHRGLVLDLFAGSGSLAHAVMSLNAEDGGQRACISIQTPEPFPPHAKARTLGFSTICDMCTARLRKAGEQILAERLESDPPALDLGYRYFELVPVERTTSEDE